MTKNMINCFFYVILFGNTIFTILATGKLKLKFVAVVFRHGDRTPDETEMFPKDPNRKTSFYPIGYGGLTNTGKRREYELGKLLRDKFSDFLGELYLPETVFALSTDYVRTKMSLQLVLAGLYPPVGVQKWHNELNWQPVSTLFTTSEQDWLMIPEKCPKYMQHRKKVNESPEVVKKVKSFQNLMNDLSQWTGKNMSNTYDLYLLYHLLVAESFLNSTLPKWADGIFPYGQLYDAIKLEYELFSYTTDMRKLNGGKLLYEIIEEMKKVKSEKKNETRKISLYSGHETNVAALLQTLGIFSPHVPAYSSAVIIEFYKQQSQYFVKVLYYRGIPATFAAQRLPGCEILCPLENFIEILKDVTPSKNELICHKNKKK